MATSVTVGKDGRYYVGELRGFPATPGTSQIWRIAPGTTNATCDPENPNVGPCRRFADGLTSIVDLAPAKDGGIYAIELVKTSWAAWELLGAPPIGGLFKVPAGGGVATESGSPARSSAPARSSTCTEPHDSSPAARAAGEERRGNGSASSGVAH